MNIRIILLILIMSTNYIYCAPVLQDLEIFGPGSFNDDIDNFNNLLESLQSQDVEEDNITKIESSIGQLKNLLNIIKNNAALKVQEEEYFREFLADKGFYPHDKIDLEGQQALDEFNKVIKSKFNSIALIEKQIFAILKEQIDDYTSDLDDINSAMAIGDTQTARDELEKARADLDFIRYKTDEDIGDDEDLKDFLSDSGFYLPGKLKLEGSQAQQEFDSEIKLKLDALKKIEDNINKMEKDAADKLNKLTNSAPTNISINNQADSSDIHSQIDAWLKTSGEVALSLFGVVTVVQVLRGKWSPSTLAKILTSENKAKAFLEELAKTNPAAAKTLQAGLDKGQLSADQADLILERAGIKITETDIPKVKLIIQASDNPVALSKALREAGVKFESQDLAKLKSAFQKELGVKVLSAQDRLKLAKENLAKEMASAQAEAAEKAKAIGASVTDQIRGLQSQMEKLQTQLIEKPNDPDLQKQIDDLQDQIDAFEPEPIG